MRRALAIAVVLAAALATGSAAHAAKLVTWETTSRFVDPATVTFNGPPPDVPPRPNALRVNVLLPDGYDGRRRFPVLYLLHGVGDGYDHWASPKRGDVANVARGFPGIVVMPEGARGWYANWWRGGARGGPAWERYHLEELVPLVERRLRIRRGRRWHAIAGFSMGGAGATFYASQRPGYFGAAATFSGAVSIQRPEWPAALDTQGASHTEIFGDPEAQRFYWTGHNPTALVRNLRHTRVYATVGDGVPGSPIEAVNVGAAVAEAELHAHNEDFAAAARDAGVDITYRPRQGVHDWPYWRAHLGDAIGWGFFRKVTEHPRTWTFGTAARRSEAYGFRLVFERPPEELATFRLKGSRMTATGAGTVRVRTPRGKRFTAKLPFDRRLPPGH